MRFPVPGLPLAKLRFVLLSVGEVFVEGVDADVWEDVFVEFEAVGGWDVDDVAVFDHDVLGEVVFFDVLFHVEAAVVHGAVDDADDLGAGTAAAAGPAAGAGKGGVGVHVVDAEVDEAWVRDFAHDVDFARAVAGDEEGEVGDAEVLGEALHEDFFGFVEGEAFHFDVADEGELDVAVDADGEAVDADGEAADAGAAEFCVAGVRVAGVEADGFDGDGVAAVEAVAGGCGRAAQFGGLEDVAALDVGRLAGSGLGSPVGSRCEVDGGRGCGLGGGSGRGGCPGGGAGRGGGIGGCLGVGGHFARDAVGVGGRGGGEGAAHDEGGGDPGG